MRQDVNLAEPFTNYSRALRNSFPCLISRFPNINRGYNRKDLGKEEMGLSHDYRASGFGRGATSKEPWNSPNRECSLFLSCFPKSSCLLSLSFTHVGLAAIKSIKENFTRRTLTGFLFLFLRLDFYSLAQESKPSKSMEKE